MNITQAKQFLNTRYSLVENVKKWGNNRIYAEVTLPSGEKRKQYWLHNTCIVEQAGNVLELNSGGYQTVTTKKALNEVLDKFSTYGNTLHGIHQRNYIWSYVKRTWDEEKREYMATLEKLFSDGMRIYL